MCAALARSPGGSPSGTARYETSSPFVRVLLTGLPLLVTPVLHAQSSAGSENGVVIGHTLEAAGGRGVSTAFNQGRSALSQVGVGEVSTSENYIVQSGVVWMEPEILDDDPILFGPSPATGDKDGGDTVEVFGYNLTAPGAGATDVSFAGNLGSSTLVNSNTVVTTDTPAGLNAHLNPLGLSDMELTNSLGSHSATDAFYYLPALTQATHAQVGQRTKLRVMGDPSGFYVMGIGGSFGGLSVPIYPFDGALELILAVQDLTGLQALDVHGQATRKIKIPNNPGLVGSVFEFQVLAIDPTLTGGAFSNLLPVTVLP